MSYEIEKNYINIHICNSDLSGMHNHDFLELAYVLKGKALHKFGDSEEQIISSGDFFIIDYNTFHGYKSVGNEKFEVINCLFVPRLIDTALAYCREFQTLLRHYLIQIGNKYSAGIADRVFHDENGEILENLTKMLSEFNEKNVGWLEMMRSKMIEILIITARRLTVAQVGDTVSEIILKMQKNYSKNLTLADLAEKFGYSVPYLSKLFKEKTGMTFRRNLRKIRIDEACRLLCNTNDKIWVVSNTVGYTDVDFFCRIFKEDTGVTPSEFREKFS